MIKKNKLNKRALLLANWKMNLSVAESVEAAKRLVRLLGRGCLKCDLVLCPTFPALAEIAQIIKDKSISLGAQNVFWKSAGPYTGEVSPSVLSELGVHYVIVGHSERRQYLGESDTMIHQKIAACLSNKLVPVLCVGETFIERQKGQQDEVIKQQIIGALQGINLTPGDNLVVAYEPVWVIGSGQAVSCDEANRAGKIIYDTLIKIMPRQTVASRCRIIYGGSVDMGNITGFLKSGLLSGALVGGASLDVNRLLALVKQL